MHMCSFKIIHSPLGLTDPLETCTNNIQAGKTQELNSCINH